MKVVHVTCIILLLSLTVSAPVSAACVGSICTGAGLSGGIISNIQEQFDGRIVGINKLFDDEESTCEPRTYEVIIDGDPQTAYGVACLQPDGTWKMQNHYEVQVLNAEGEISIVTVDGSTGNIEEVEE